MSGGGSRGESEGGSGGGSGRENQVEPSVQPHWLRFDTAGVIINGVIPIHPDALPEQKVSSTPKPINSPPDQPLLLFPSSPPSPPSLPSPPSPPSPPRPLLQGGRKDAVVNSEKQLDLDPQPNNVATARPPPLQQAGRPLVSSPDRLSTRLVSPPMVTIDKIFKLAARNFWQKKKTKTIRGNDRYLTYMYM